MQFPKLSIILLSLLLLVNCIDKKIPKILVSRKTISSSDLPKIGSIFDHKKFRQSRSKYPMYILINANEFALDKFVVINNVSLSVGIDPDRDTVFFVSTTDEKFITQDSVYVGMSFKDARIKTIDTIFNEPGWAWILPLKSGWNAAFHFEYQEVPDTARVWFLFQR